MEISAINRGGYAGLYDVAGTIRGEESGRKSGIGLGRAGPERTGEEERDIQQEVQKLKAQEEKVKAHEAAHKAAGGQYTGAASFTYAPGPDGRSYIVAGEVQIDMSPERTPRETISKMQVVQRAAMAPADPSAQDRAVAAQAAAQATQAQQELLRQGDSGKDVSGTGEDAPFDDAVNGPKGAGETAAPPESTSDERLPPSVSGTGKDTGAGVGNPAPRAFNSTAAPHLAAYRAQAPDGDDRPAVLSAYA